MKQIINTTINFLSSKLNLTILQCLLYLVLGYMLRVHYSWSQFGIIFIVLIGIQFITHVKGVSQGMVMRQIMEEESHKLVKFLKQIEDDNNNVDDDLPN